MNAKEEILGRIRRAGVDPAGPVPREYRTADAPPAGAAQPSPQDLLALLTDRLEDYRATVHRAAPARLAEVAGRCLVERGARRVVVPVGLALRPAGVEVVVDSPDRPLSPLELDALDGVVTGCALAIAETGTLVLDASPDQGRRVISLVPDLHLVVVEAGAVVATVPQAVARMRPDAPLTMISGPSATSDIELSRVEGVHGPRALVVILVSEQDDLSGEDSAPSGKT